nr:MAG TPA: hypothetical protein [Bacteriophage sp.]
MVLIRQALLTTANTSPFPALRCWWTMKTA